MIHDNGFGCRMVGEWMKRGRFGGHVKICILKNGQGMRNINNANFN